MWRQTTRIRCPSLSIPPPAGCCYNCGQQQALPRWTSGRNRSHRPRACQRKMSETIKNLAWTAAAVVVGMIAYNLVKGFLPASLRG